jgi:hypothetical protein
MKNDWGKKEKTCSAYISSKIFANSARVWTLFHTDLHKMKINTELCCKRYDFLTKKTQNYCYQNYCPGWQYSNLFIWPSMWTQITILVDNIPLSKKSYFIYKSTYKKFCILKAAGEIYWKHEQEWDNLEFNFFVNN